VVPTLGALFDMLIVCSAMYLQYPTLHKLFHLKLKSLSFTWCNLHFSTVWRLKSWYWSWWGEILVSAFTASMGNWLAGLEKYMCSYLQHKSQSSIFLLFTHLLYGSVKKNWVYVVKPTQFDTGEVDIQSLW